MCTSRGLVLLGFLGLMGLSLGGCEVTVVDDDDNAGGSSGSSTAGSGGSSGAGAGGAGSGGAGAGGAGAAGEGGAGAGGGGQAGSGGDGSQQIPEGPPGAVGNKCKDDGTCDPNLICSQTNHCQPEATSLPSNIKQAVPPPDTADVPASSPIFLFSDGKYTNVSFSLKAYTEQGSQDITPDTVVTKLTSGADKDIWVLSSKSGFPLGSSVVIKISGEIEGTLVFNIDHATPAFADDALGLEGGAPASGGQSEPTTFFGLPKGWTGFGDVATLPATGSLAPTEGQRMAVMTTGAAVGGKAIDNTSSLLISGPIHFGPSVGLTFDYEFQSSEFDDYCASSYDDTFLAVLVGPKGAVAKVVNTVNLICAEKTHVDATFPGMPDGGDSVYKETGNKSFLLSGDVGQPAVVAFVLTDVGDSALSSVTSIDRLQIVK